MVDLISELIKWDQEIFLQSVFISLDMSSLGNCREVTKTWRYFVEHRVWGCEKFRAVLLGRLWQDCKPEHRELVVGGSVTNIGCDDKLILCGYSDGVCEVFCNDEAGECIARFSDAEEGVYYTGSRVELGKDIIVKIACGSDTTGKVVIDVGVWSKKTGKRIFRSLVDDQNNCLHVRVVENCLFIRRGFSMGKISVDLNTVVQEDLQEMECTFNGDFLTNGEFFVFKCENTVSCHKLGCDESEARYIITEKKILAMTMKWPHVVTLHQDSFSVVNFNNISIQLKGRSLANLKSVYSNPSVVAILNSNNGKHLYKWTDLIQPTSTLCHPISSLRLPLPTSPYSLYPCIALYATGLVAVDRGANCLHVYQLGNGIGKEDMEDSVDVKVENIQMMELVDRKNSGAGIRDY